MSGAADIAADRSAQASLRTSLTAAVTYYTDAATYGGLTPGEIRTIEPDLDYVPGDAPSADDSTLSITVPPDGEGDVYAAAALPDSGMCFTIRDDRSKESATTFGVITDGSPCTGEAALLPAETRWP
ncbi:MAG TPA: hypothetical protein VLA82_11800 [Actinomycetota bacterium]|nr:hypothetical protein [Actinomycetota bacterium]